MRKQDSLSRSLARGPDPLLLYSLLIFIPILFFLYSRDPFQTQTGRDNKAGQKNMIVGQAARATNVNFNTNNRGGTAVNQAQATAAQVPSYGDNGTNQFTPGPGAYSVTNGFDKIGRDMQEAKTLQGFGLD